MNGVDEPTAYASLFRIKPGIYVEQERNAANPSTPHFAIRAGDSVISLSSHNGRTPFSISGPVQNSGPVSFQNILTPGQTGTMSMQLPRGYRNGGSSSEHQTRSLRGVSSGAHQRPPIPSAMQPQNPDANSRRASMPLKSIRDTHNQLNPGKSLPTLSASSQSSSPYSCPPTPQISDPPVPYLLPTKPWYKNDYESTKLPVSYCLFWFCHKKILLKKYFHAVIHYQSVNFPFQNQAPIAYIFCAKMYKLIHAIL